MSELVPGLVSVVVPIYNVEAFLRECLDSLRAQTYRDLQVILVDDGCTDGSPAIAEEFVAADQRFRLIRQANAGLSAARNAGIPYATGEFLAFVDSDDVLAAHAYDVLVTALAGGADFASGGVHRYNSRGHHRGYPHNEVITSTDLNAHVSRDHRLLRDRTIWNKLFRRTFWDAHGFEFPPGRLFEDVPVCVPAHALASRVAVVNEPIYFWRVREGAVRSITQSDNDLRNLVDRFYSVNLTRRLLTEAGHPELRRVYEEQAIWDKLSSYLKYLPTASAEFRASFQDLAGAYLADIDPGAVERQPAKVRRQWELIRDRRMDDLVELIDAGFRGAKRPAGSVDSALTGAVWRDGKLDLTGYARVPGAAPQRWKSLRALWLSLDGSRRRLPLRTRSAAEPGGFAATVDPESLRTGGEWRNGTWTVAVAATHGIRLRRDGLRVDAARRVRLTRQRVAHGVWVSPVVTRGRLRLMVVRANGWLTASRQDGDDLILEGRLRRPPAGPVRVRLTRGVVAQTVDAEVSDGTTFTARIPLRPIALDDRSANHAIGLYAQRFAVELVLDGKPGRLAADDDYRPTRVVLGTDEVYTTAADDGIVRLCTRPAGPVITKIDRTAGGALVFEGDCPRPADGELLLRMRGRRRDVGLPLRVTDSRWSVTVDPDAVPGLAGPLPLPAGTWDLGYREGRTVAPLTCTDAVLAALPPEMTAMPEERAALVIDPAEPATRPAGDPGPLRDVVLFDRAPGRRYFDDPAAVLAELVSRPDAPPALWTAERGEPVPAGAQAVTLGGRRWQEALGTSRWVVTNDDLPRWFTPRAGQVVLRLGGGWPIARSGVLAQAHPLGRELVEQVTADAAKWTALVSPGPSATPILRAELAFDGEVLETGRPGDDLLANGDAEAARAEVLRRLDLPPDTRLVLYAPTHRPMDLRKRGWSDPGRLLDLPRVAAGLPAGHVLLARRHPDVPDDVVGARDVSDYPRVAELLLATDVLITDYSTLMADFAGTGRPILLYVPDLAEFTASPGLHVDLAASAPGPLLSTADDVVAALATALPGAGAEFAERHGVSGRGRAAVEIVDWLLDKNSGRP